MQAVMAQGSQAVHLPLGAEAAFGQTKMQRRIFSEGGAGFDLQGGLGTAGLAEGLEWSGAFEPGVEAGLLALAARWQLKAKARIAQERFARLQEARMMIAKGRKLLAAGEQWFEKAPALQAQLAALAWWKPQPALPMEGLMAPVVGAFALRLQTAGLLEPAPSWQIAQQWGQPFFATLFRKMRQ